MTPPPSAAAGDSGESSAGRQVAASPAGPTSPDLAGRVLGRFVLHRTVGHGGTSVLYDATDRRLDRRVAVKVLHPFLAEDPDFHRRFLQEARFVAALEHPHVIPLYDVGDEDGYLFLAMRHVDGTDLARRVRDDPLTLHDALEVLDQLAQALDALHRRGLVHLDVKPSNVLVDHDPDGAPHIYLADFGLVSRSGERAHLTAEGHFVGSPAFAAPEHIENARVDAAADVYSLGCVVFSCLAGHPPYVGRVEEVMDGHVAGRPPSLAHARTGQTRSGSEGERGLAVGDQVDEVIRRCLALNPAERPGSVSEFVDQLRQAMTADSAVQGAHGVDSSDAVAGSALPLRALPPAATLRVGVPVGPADVRPFIGGPASPPPALVAGLASALIVVVLLLVLFLA